MFLSKLDIHTTHMPLAGNTLKAKLSSLLFWLEKLYLVIVKKKNPLYTLTLPSQPLLPNFKWYRNVGQESECPVAPSPEIATGNNWNVIMYKFSLTSTIDFFPSALICLFYSHYVSCRFFQMTHANLSCSSQLCSVLSCEGSLACLTNSLLNTCVSWFEIFILKKNPLSHIGGFVLCVAHGPEALIGPGGLLEVQTLGPIHGQLAPCTLALGRHWPGTSPPVHYPRGHGQSAAVAVLQGSTAWGRLHLALDTVMCIWNPWQRTLAFLEYLVGSFRNHGTCTIQFLKLFLFEECSPLSLHTTLCGGLISLKCPCELLYIFFFLEMNH